MNGPYNHLTSIKIDWADNGVGPIAYVGTDPT
jgi:hypothetical protein